MGISPDVAVTCNFLLDKNPDCFSKALKSINYRLRRNRDNCKGVFVFAAMRILWIWFYLCTVL
jgi:hypothetical protein